MMCGMYFALKELELEKNTKYTFKQSFSIYFLNLIANPHHKKERLKKKKKTVCFCKEYRKQHYTSVVCCTVEFLSNYTPVSPREKPYRVIFPPC